MEYLQKVVEGLTCAWEEDTTCSLGQWALVGVVVACACGCTFLCGGAIVSIPYIFSTEDGSLRKISKRTVAAPGINVSDVAYLEFGSLEGEQHTTERDTADDPWDAEPANEADTTPLVLHVVSPNMHPSCAGAYGLVVGERPNGDPLWKKNNGNRWLYTGMDGRWYIGGAASKEKSFSCSSGFLFSEKLCETAFPDEGEDVWQIAVGKQWQKDVMVTVSSTAPRATVPCAVALPRLPFSEHNMKVDPLDFAADVPSETVDSSMNSTAASTLSGGKAWRKLPTQASKGYMEESSNPGLYTITFKDCAVTSGISIGSGVIDSLASGMAVNVMEVVHVKEDRRVRGRIEKPTAGWISLSSMEDGYKWVKKSTPSDSTTEEPTLEDTSTERDASTEMGNSFTLPDLRAPPVAATPWVTPWRRVGHRDQLDIEPPEFRSLPPILLPLVRRQSSLQTPLALYVHSPNAQQAHSGAYFLVKDECPNGLPVWKHEDADHWLYSGTNERWCIGGKDVVAENFNRRSGFIAQTKRHDGLMPDRSTSCWQRWDASTSGFCQDPDIRVSVLNEATDLSVPRILRVVSQSSQTTCAGTYYLVPDERPNEHPAWVRSKISGCSGSRWLYSGTDGRWYIGGSTARSRNFGCSLGHIFHNQVHHGVLPHLLEGPWSTADRGSWRRDFSVTIQVESNQAAEPDCTPRSAPSTAPSRQKEARSAAEWLNDPTAMQDPSEHITMWV